MGNKITDDFYARSSTYLQLISLLKITNELLIHDLADEVLKNSWKKLILIIKNKILKKYHNLYKNYAIIYNCALKVTLNIQRIPLNV